MLQEYDKQVMDADPASAREVRISQNTGQVTEIMSQVGLQALISLFVHIVVFILTWWALQSLKFDLLFRHPKSLQARMLYILLALAVSYPVARFFLDYVNWSMTLPQIYG